VAKRSGAERTSRKPREKREYVRIAVLGIGGAAAAFFMFGGLGSLGKSGPTDPFDAIPRSSFIAATVDFAELRRSPVYEAVFGKEAPGADGSLAMRRALGVGALADACGFDPTTRVQRIAVSVPEEGDRGEFGVAARVEVTRDELETCTRSLAEKRGGKAETHDVGSFVVLEDTTGAGGGASSRPRLAYGRGGLLVVGKGTWFDAMLGAADRTKPGLRDATEHIALRTSLTSREGFRSPTVIATAILPRALRDRLKHEMGAEVGSQDTSSAIMAGVLGVSALGLAIHAGGTGQNVDASLELVCDSADACEAVDKLAQKKRGEWSRDLSLRMIGFGPLLDSFEVKRDGARLRATASASADALASTIERVMKLRARRGAADGAPAAPPPKERPSERPADEMMHAKPDGGAGGSRGP
jgi:hypothetical protein